MYVASMQPMAATSLKNMESVTLRQYTGVLCTAIASNVVEVATKLFEKELISLEQLREAQLQSKTTYLRANGLVSDVIARVSFQPEAFRVFLDVLKECGVAEGVVKEVYKRYADNQAVRKVRNISQSVSIPIQEPRSFGDSNETPVNQREVESYEVNRDLPFLPSVVQERMKPLSADQMKHTYLHMSNKCACSLFFSVATLIILYWVTPHVIQFFSTDNEHYMRETLIQMGQSIALHLHYKLDTCLFKL